MKEKDLNNNVRRVNLNLGANKALINLVDQIKAANDNGNIYSRDQKIP